MKDSAHGGKSMDHMALTGTEVTIRDIAKALDISHSTVSRALADSEKISLKTRQRVRSMVDQLGYVPSASARVMRGGRSPLVGLIVPDIQNDFYASAAKGIADALAAHSMQLMLSITENDPVRELRELRVLLELRPYGVIVVPSGKPQRQTAALLRHTRVLQLLRPNADLHGYVVTVDEHTGIHNATRHLLDYGHKQIAYIGSSIEFSTARERLAAFKNAMAEQGLEATSISVGMARPEFGRSAVLTLMSRSERPTALILGSSDLTLGALQGLRSLGLTWPEDVSVVGYHDPAWFELAERGISTIRIPVQDMVTTAVNLLLSDPPPGAADPAADASIQFAPTLVLRGSTAPLKTD